MDLNLFKNRKTEGNFINKFIEELKNALENTISQNHNKNENDNVMDDKSVCISENGDGGPFFINEFDIPNNAKVGDVYEKIDGEYVYNRDITAKLKEII